MNKIKIELLFILVMLSACTAFSQYQITGSVIGSGGYTITNADYIFNSTISEAFIGKSLNAANQQLAGFWYVYQQQTITSVADNEIVPTVFKLEQNYPNPFNPSTTIRFAVPARSIVTIKIYDITGSVVAAIVNNEMNAGWYERKFNASALSSGVYFYRMQAVPIDKQQAGDYLSIKKMLLIK